MIFQFRDFVIQKTVIHALRDFSIQNFFELLQIEHHSGDRIGFAGDGDFQSVVVAVAVWIIAFAEDAPVLFRGQSGIVVQVRGGKFEFARKVDDFVAIY